MRKIKGMNCDIAVVGCGGAGLMAALAAKEADAKVVIIERRPVAGGNSNFPRGGTFAVGSKKHKDKGLNFTTDDVFKNIMAYGHWRGNARLVRAFLEKTADTVEWMEKRGVEFNDIPTWAHHSDGYVTGIPIKGNGVACVKALLKSA